MKLFSIALDSKCPYSHELTNLIYELGHNIVSSKPDETVSETEDAMKVDFTLKRYHPDDIDLGSRSSVYISVAHESDNEDYIVSILAPFEGQLARITKSVIKNGFTHNGADIHKEICTVVEQCVSLTLIRLSQGLTKDNTISSEELVRYSEVDLHELKFWHKSNETIDDGEYYQGLYEAFVNTVRLLPQKTAVKFGDTSISYKELEGKVERYASNIQNLLRSGSCTEQQVIAIALPKSIELYATILAVLKINACYVPIDPEYPEDRIKNILKGSKPQLLIGTLNFEKETRATSIDALEQNTTIGTTATPFKNEENTSQNAVMIYTSGSTGVPKGVQLTHQNVAHFCHWYITETNLSYDSRCLQFTTVSFDASLLDIFPTFTAGGTLIVPSSEQRHDFEQLNNLILEESVTHCFIPPAMLSAMPQYSWPSMKYIITGGDVCDSAAIDHWSGQSNLVNVYGPTECTVLATFKRLEQGCNNKIIGQPINNTQVYLINEKGEPCQTLEQGELYVAGKGVGSGYVRDIIQTNERFAPIESNSKAGKTYRTGDICFWDNNGEINFIGRRDNQLKIRGFRVELGEIENTILQLDLYTGCVVIADDKKQIRAFVKGPKSDVSIDQFRVKLRECLPDYMMPVLIKELQEFPYTVNGKVDRKKLAEFKVRSVGATKDEVWSKLQTELREIWAESLDVDAEDLSLSSSFFDMGGHSLLVSKMLLTVRNTYEGSFTLARFMENPTIEALSKLLSSDNLTKGAQISDRIYADLVLNQKVSPFAEENLNAFNPRAVLLTGATGFLGVHILEQLVQKTDAIIYCHIRASSQEYALKKLAENHKKFGVNDLNKNPRIKVVCGDLAAPQLGLTDSDYQMLCGNVDVIYHNGAQVNHIYDYTYLYNANVRSTIDLLSMACTGQQKQVVYVSTLSAASNLNEQGHIVEEGPAGQLPAFVNNGYNLTKWVSEQLVWQAYERGLPITLVRPGNITGHSQTGHCFPDQNRILLLLKGAAQMGVAPNWDLQFDLCPVDFIAKGLVEGSLDKVKHTPVLHFHNPKPLTWKQYVGRLNHHGIPIKFISDDKWRSMLLTLDESNALYQVVSFYLDENSEDIGDISNIDYKKTLNRLNQSGLDYPEKDNKLIDANLGYLISSGFIPETVNTKLVTS